MDLNAIREIFHHIILPKDLCYELIETVYPVAESDTYKEQHILDCSDCCFNSKTSDMYVVKFLQFIDDNPINRKLLNEELNCNSIHSNIITIRDKVVGVKISKINTIDEYTKVLSNMYNGYYSYSFILESQNISNLEIENLIQPIFGRHGDLKGYSIILDKEVFRSHESICLTYGGFDYGAYLFLKLKGVDSVTSPKKEVIKEGNTPTGTF